MKGILLGISASVVFLMTMAAIHDAAKRAIYGDEYVNEQAINARKQQDYMDFVFHQQAADTATLDASNKQARANEARRRMFNESYGR